MVISSLLLQLIMVVCQMQFPFQFMVYGSFFNGADFPVPFHINFFNFIHILG